VQVVVNNPISVSNFTTSPLVVTYPNNATFSITASNVVSYQWQQKTNAVGATFQNFSPAETGTSLTVTSPGVAMSGYQYKVNLTASAPCSNDSRTATLTVNPAPLCLTYDGLTFATTNTSGVYVAPDGSKIIKLIWLVDGGFVGDLSTATLTGIIGSTSFTATYASATGSDPAYFYFNWSVPDLNSSTNSITYELDWTIGGNYSGGTCNETEALITISRPSPDFTTGGGYIFNNKSKGTVGIAVNETPGKNNYGFNLKWGNNLKTLQGTFTTVIRKSGRQYQVKTNKPTFLAIKARTDLAYVVNGKTITPYEAIMTYENAVLKDLTGLANKNCTGSVIPACSQGGGLVYLRVIDMGEPNSGATVGTINRIDSISMLIKASNGTVFYSSEAYTVINNPAVIKLLPIVKGNIQVHVAGANSSARLSTDNTLDATAAQLNLRALPNPTDHAFTLQLQGNGNEKMSVRVTDIMGRTVQLMQNLSAGQTIQVGSGYKPGVYIAELIQGNKHKLVKLVKH
jgi:hypothetical protein